MYQLKLILIYSLFIFLILSPRLTFSKTINSIKTYLTDIPDKYLELRADSNGHRLTKKERLNVIKVIDEKNGFISIESNLLTNAFSIALFNRSNGTAIIGILEDGASIQQPIKFILKKANHWENVTAEVFPKISKDYILKKYNQKKPNGKTYSMHDLNRSAHSSIRYVLPRSGTTIIALAGSEDDGASKTELFKLIFDGVKFVAEE